MTPSICVTCGTQFSPTPAPPASCPICQDERQYIGAGGQRWTTAQAMQATHMNAWRQHEPGLFGIGTVPAFAIGQRALLIQAPGGNVLWDCVSLLDDATVALVRALGGVRAIAISHPHYYSAMVDWAHAFAAEILLHEADAAHVMRPDPSIRFWSGASLDLGDGLSLLHAPGHFDGAAMLHWAAGAGGAGVLLSGDIYQVIPDRRFIGFMRSYPNLIPLSAPQIRTLAAVTENYAFTRIYGAWWDRVVPHDAKAVVARSVSRYLAALNG